MGFAKYGIVDDAFLPRMIERCVDDTERGMIYILYYTGMHGSILRTLTLENLKREGDAVYLRWNRTKTGKVMEAPIPKDKLDIIRSYLLGRKNTIQWTNVLLHRIGRSAGYDGVSTMTFRHSRVINLIRGGMPLPVIAQVMGCTEEVISRNYGKLTETQKRNGVLR